MGEPLREHVRLVTEADRVAQHKAAIDAALKPVVEAMEAARKDGFFTEFNINLSQFGVYQAVPVALIKRFWSTAYG